LGASCQSSSSGDAVLELVKGVVGGAVRCA
jgi:hypothetical protein